MGEVWLKLVGRKQLNIGGEKVSHGALRAQNLHAQGEK